MFIASSTDPRINVIINLAITQLTNTFVEIKEQAALGADPHDIHLLLKDCRHLEFRVSFLLVAAGVNDRRNVHN